MTGSSARFAGGLVAAGVVDLEVSDELVVDVDAGVGGVADDGGGGAGVFDSDVDVVFVERDLALVAYAGFAYDRSVQRGVREGLVGWLGAGGGVPALDRDAAADALVGSFVVVDPTELIELGLQFAQ